VHFRSTTISTITTINVNSGRSRVMAVSESPNYQRAHGTTRKSNPWLSNETASQILLYTHFSYPVILLAVFLFAFTLHSILTVPRESVIAASQTKTGPGGKPLPKNTSSSDQDRKRKQILDFSVGQKLCFNWLSVALIITFIGDAVNIIAHALKEKPWWCGQPVAVRWSHLDLASLANSTRYMSPHQSSSTH
jgi:hypothetical protein